MLKKTSWTEIVAYTRDALREGFDTLETVGLRRRDAAVLELIDRLKSLKKHVQLNCAARWFGYPNLNWHANQKADADLCRSHGLPGSPVVHDCGPGAGPPKARSAKVVMFITL